MAKKKRKLSAYNRHVQREMKKGKTMKQAASSWKSGRRSPRKSPKRASPSRRRKPAKKGGTRKVGKSGFNSQKIFKYVRLAALLAPAINEVMRTTDNSARIRGILARYTGFDTMTGKFNGSLLVEGYMPYIGAVLATYGVPKLAGILRGL